MASRGSVTPPPPNNPTTTTTTTNSTTRTTDTTANNNTRGESFLSRKKKEIVDRSMALFQLNLDRYLDNSAAAAVSSSTSSTTPAGANAAGAGVVRRRVKRGREEDDEHNGGDGGGVYQGGDGKGGVAVKKKRANPKDVVSKKGKEGGGGKKFACPFCKHDPGKYRSVKTCCGPGWDDVHRVKEHIYRRHSWKSFCPRCFEHFDKAEALKSHQRADVPCKLRERAPDAITEEQEKLLRARAKSHCSEEMKWEEMYRIIFPDEKVPSPYYDSDNDASAKAEKSRFQNMDECRDYLRREVPRVVRAAMEQYVDRLFVELQDRVDRKTVEIIRDVETTMFRTFHFQEELSTATAPADAAAGGGDGPGSSAPQGSAAEPSPPPSPGPEMAKMTQLFDELRDDAHYNELCNNLHFDVDELLASTQEFGCDNFSVDSAYWTSSSSGGQGSFSGGGEGYLRY